MCILARVDRSVLLNTVLVISRFAVALWVNTHYIFFLHEYMGAANKSINVGLYLLILAFACGAVWRRDSQARRFSVLISSPFKISWSVRR